MVVANSFPVLRLWMKIDLKNNVNEWRKKETKIKQMELNMKEIEHFFDCPYCGENISMLIDLSFNNQFYTEDCEVCCRPIEINFKAVDGAIESWEASRGD